MDDITHDPSLGQIVIYVTAENLKPVYHPAVILRRSGDTCDLFVMKDDLGNPVLSVEKDPLKTPGTWHEKTDSVKLLDPLGHSIEIQRQAYMHDEAYTLFQSVYPDLSPNYFLIVTLSDPFEHQGPEEPYYIPLETHRYKYPGTIIEWKSAQLKIEDLDCVILFTHPDGSNFFKYPAPN